MRELVIIVLLVVAADVLVADTRPYERAFTPVSAGYATRIFPILDPATGRYREAHPAAPPDPSPLAPTFAQRWPAPPHVRPVLTGKDFNWVIDDTPRTIIFRR